MALSDTCSDTLHQLGEGLVRYSDLGYKPEQLIPIIDALYNLATFTVRQDTPPEMSITDPSIGISRVVVGAILGVELDHDCGKKSAAAILTLLPQIAKIHPKLAKSLDEVYVELAGKPENFLTKMFPNMLTKLEAVRSNQT
jgi:hypothetical protein